MRKERQLLLVALAVCESSAPVFTNMELVSVLESHRGRDKIVRLCTYAAMLLGDSGRGDVHRKLLIISGELGAARMTMRLFDDLSMLLSNFKYGLGSKVGINVGARSNF